MTKLLKGLALGAVALALAVPGAAGAADKVVKLGCYAPMTGPLAKYGKSMQEGFDMAIADFAASGKLKDASFAIKCEDSQGRADDGINLARKFVDDKDVVAVLGDWSSTVTMAAAPIFDQAKLVNLTPISSHPDVTKLSPWVFRQSIIQSKEGAANAAYLQALGAKKIAIIAFPNDFGKANVGALKALYTKAGGEVVFEEFIKPDAQDFRAILTKLQRDKPDMIYMGLFPPHASLVMKQAKQLGIDIPFYGNSALSTDDMTRLAGDAANGLHLLLVFHPVVNKEMAEFFKRYQAKFGAAPEVFAVNSYISATMLMDILAKQYPNITRASVKDGLDTVRKIDSIAGPLTYDPATREWDFQFHRGMIKDGQFVLVTK